MIPCFNEATCMRSTNLEYDVMLSSQAGFRRIELRKEKLMSFLRSGNSLRDVRTLYDKYGMQPVCINALQGTYMRTPQDEVGLKDACDFLCYCARYLGIKHLEYIPPFNVPIEDPEELEEYTVKSLKMLSDIAMRYGVKLAIEYMGLPGNSIQTFNDCLRIVDKVGRSNVGILMDTWHHYAWGGKPEDILKATNNQIFMVHVSDCPERAVGTAKRVESIWPGEGVVPITEDLINLKAVGYDSDISIEIFDPEVQKADPDATVVKAWNSISEAIQKAE